MYLIKVFKVGLFYKVFQNKRYQLDWILNLIIIFIYLQSACWEIEFKLWGGWEMDCESYPGFKAWCQDWLRIRDCGYGTQSSQRVSNRYFTSCVLSWGTVICPPFSQIRFIKFVPLFSPLQVWAANWPHEGTFRPNLQVG